MKEAAPKYDAKKKVDEPKAADAWAEVIKNSLGRAKVRSEPQQQQPEERYSRKMKREPWEAMNDNEYWETCKKFDETWGEPATEEMRDNDYDMDKESLDGENQLDSVNGDDYVEAKPKPKPKK